MHESCTQRESGGGVIRSPLDKRLKTLDRYLVVALAHLGQRQVENERVIPRLDLTSAAKRLLSHIEAPFFHGVDAHQPNPSYGRLGCVDHREYRRYVSIRRVCTGFSSEQEPRAAHVRIDEDEIFKEVTCCRIFARLAVRVGQCQKTRQAPWLARGR